MAVYMKCDRCGKEIAQIVDDGTKLICGVDRIKIGTYFNYDGTFNIQHTFDLCPDCSVAFYNEFMTQKEVSDDSD